MAMMLGMLRRIAVLIPALALVACGAETPPSPTPSPTRDAQTQAERRDTDIEKQLRARAKAAAADDRDAVSAAEKELDRLTDEAPPPAAQGGSEDPFFDQIKTFPFKQAPLYVQQIVSGADHRLFARVNEDAFCLLTPEAREDGASTVYAPMQARLRSAGVNDFEFWLTPLSSAMPRERDALAVGRDGSLRLTAAGHAC